MPETPYCPVLSINKDVPVLCQEELCMWYVKQLKLCSVTVLAYTNAINMQGVSVQTPITATQPIQKPQSTVSSQAQQAVKPPLTREPKKEQPKVNPFALDDLD